MVKHYTISRPISKRLSLLQNCCYYIRVIVLRDLFLVFQHSTNMLLHLNQIKMSVSNIGPASHQCCLFLFDMKKHFRSINIQSVHPVTIHKNYVRFFLFIFSIHTTELTLKHYPKILNS